MRARLSPQSCRGDISALRHLERMNLIGWFHKLPGIPISRKQEGGEERGGEESTQQSRGEERLNGRQQNRTAEPVYILPALAYLTLIQ